MAINLLALEPHKVSRDLSGYISYVYGPAKVGKTTLGSKMPNPLLLAFERGYNALPGIYAQDITSWSELKQVVRELKKPEVKEKFSTVIIDTVDIAAALCDKYVCSQNNVDKIGEIPYGGGWGLLKREFEETFRTITQYGYAVLFISHDKEGTFKRQDGTEYTLIRPSVSTMYNSIIENMVDIYAYMHPVVKDGISTIKMTLRSIDGTIAAGGRFKYIVPEIDASYDALVKALQEAIDKEASETGGKFVTDEKSVAPIVQELDYDVLMTEFQETIQGISARVSPEDFETIYQPKITQIIERYLGRGKKVSQATRDQVEQISLIVADLKEI